MSEFSDSFHIRAEDADAAGVIKELRKAKLAGLVFGPANGWLAFVPYENHPQYLESPGPEDFARALSRAIAKTVLHYRYAEDHGWGFTLVQPSAPVCRFACWWDPEPSIESDQFDLGALPIFISKEKVAPLLQMPDAAAHSSENPAYRFAELLGLPAFKWLSPALVQKDTVTFLSQGATKVGTKPSGTAERLRVPPSRKLALPRPDLSGREALDLVAPHMGSIVSEWKLVVLSAVSGLDLKGRTGVEAGAWQLNYVRNDGLGSIVAWLFSNGNLGFSGDTAPAGLRAKVERPLALSDEWVDSTQVADVIAQEPPWDGWPTNFSNHMSLRQTPAGPFWTVQHTVVGAQFAMSTRTWAIEGRTGRVVLEGFERRASGQIVEEWTRDRGR